MSDGRHYGGWDVMVKAFGPIHRRFQRKAGEPEKWAGFTDDGRQITQFDNNFPIDKQYLLPWAEEEMRRQ